MLEVNITGIVEKGLHPMYIINLYIMYIQIRIHLRPANCHELILFLGLPQGTSPASGIWLEKTARFAAPVGWTQLEGDWMMTVFGPYDIYLYIHSDCIKRYVHVYTKHVCMYGIVQIL